jgi:hypothetical protein
VKKGLTYRKMHREKIARKRGRGVKRGGRSVPRKGWAKKGGVEGEEKEKRGIKKKGKEE